MRVASPDNLPVIDKVDPSGIAAQAGINAKDKVVSLNGRELRDVIDYEMLRIEDVLEFKLLRRDQILTVSIENTSGFPLGIYFEKSIFDKEKLCENNCQFCFINQLPPGLRQTLYLKDDDFRLSFLYGNFITLTNLSQVELKRIVEQRLSPLYVSLHSTNPNVRRALIEPPKVDRALDNLKALLAGGIDIHLQIVVCPGLNDGDKLAATINDLWTDFPALSSVGIVPVGLTGYRSALPHLEGFTKDKALELIAQLKVWQKRALEEKDYRWVYAADEFYLLAQTPLPALDEYDDCPQVENGIGISRIFIEEVKGWAVPEKVKSGSRGPLNIVTSVLGAKVIDLVLADIAKPTGYIPKLIKAENDFLGGDVSVAGLLSGSDIMKAIDLAEPTGLIVIPDVALDTGGLFLDNLTVSDIINKTGRDIRIVPSGGSAFMEALTTQSS